MKPPRALVDPPLRAGARVPLGERTAQHWGRVLRLRPGDAVRVFNAIDGEWAGAIEAFVRDGVVVAVGERLRAPERCTDLRLLFAPVKRQATDWIVEKATELGARALTPVLTRRTQAETVRLERLMLIAEDAAIQCERLDAPRIDPPIPLEKVLAGWSGGVIAFADESGDATPMAQALGAIHSPSLAALIGPEGGFAPEERAALRAHGSVVPVSLGPLILRAETAAVAALALAQAVWGARQRLPPPL